METGNQMQMYFGTKMVAARPMTRAAYNDYRGWQLPADENGADEGYLVEYQDGGAGNHPDHEGYISWSPKVQFEKAYQDFSQLSFGHAIDALKTGRRLRRAGWNGKGMYIWLEDGSFDRGDDLAQMPALINGVDSRLFELADRGTITRMPHLCMRAADGATVTGWLASQTDMLAEDWQIVE